jgi:hypothetical protein
MRTIQTTLAALLFAASTVALAQGEPAQVATLNKAEGTVMVDQGKGFVSSKVNAALREGDRVITLSGSGAEIVFADGCRAQLKANNMMTIALNPGCKAAIVSVNGAAATGGATAGAAAGSGVPLTAMAGPAMLGGFVFLVGQAVGGDDTPISAE